MKRVPPDALGGDQRLAPFLAAPFELRALARGDARRLLRELRPGARGELGPILWQLPPQLPLDAQRLASFFAILPRTASAAARMAAGHDARVKDGVHLQRRGDRPLREHDIALCIADTAGKYPQLDEVASGLVVYARLHGEKDLHVSGYGSAAFDRWAGRVATWRDAGRDVHVYFDNDVKVRPPYDAMDLAARRGHGAPVRSPRSAQRAVEAVRGVEIPLATSDRWKLDKTRRTA